MGVERRSRKYSTSGSCFRRVFSSIKGHNRMEWLRDRVFGRFDMQDDHRERQRLVESSTSSTRSVMGARQSAPGENQAFQLSPVGEACTSASTSAMVARTDRRGDVQRQRHSRSLSPAHPEILNNGLDDMLRPYKLDLLLNSPLLDPKLQELHAWNPDDRSVNIFVKDDDPFTLHRHPVAQSTDCIRGKMGYSRGFHVWQIDWPQRQRGTHAVVGVGTKAAGLHATGYTALIGTNTESFGWDLTRGECYHDSKHCKPWRYPSSDKSSFRFAVPDKFYCILDMDDGYMAFATDEEFLGVAFRNLKGKTLHPMVSAVWGHCEITMKYLGGIEPQPRTLMDECRRTIRRQMGRNRLRRVDELRLPPVLKRFLLHKI